VNPRPDEVEALARTIDRVVFSETRSATQGQSPAVSGLVSYLNESFPRVSPAAARRQRLERRILRALGIPSGPANPTWLRLEAEMNRRLRNINPRWTPVLGGAAIVLIGVVGFAYWRQRAGERPAVAASLR
jgi:hypothetical protein